MTSRFSVESTAPHNPSAMNKPHLRGMGAPTPRGGLAYEERKTEMEDVFEVLAEDHEEIGAVLAELEKGPTAATGACEDQLMLRKMMTEELVIEEAKHADVERMYLWPAVREHVPGGGPPAGRGPPPGAPPPPRGGPAAAGGGGGRGGGGSRVGPARGGGGAPPRRRRGG